MHFFNRILGRLSAKDPVPHCYILTGIPRAGTTLTCKLLSEQEQVIGLNEPIRFRELQSLEDALSRVHNCLTEFRGSLLREGVAPVRGIDGQITDNHFDQSKSGHRKLVIQRSDTYFDKPLSPDFKLFVKHNAVFTLLLNELNACYPCYAMVRNPLALLGSWATVNVPVSRGKIRYLALLDPEAQSQLAQIEGLLNRQLFLLDYYFKIYSSLPRCQVLRYEDLIASNGGLLSDVIGQPYIGKTHLTGKNKSSVYPREQMLQMGAALLAQENHHCWAFYGRQEVEALCGFYEDQG